MLSCSSVPAVAGRLGLLLEEGLDLLRQGKFVVGDIIEGHLGDGYHDVHTGNLLGCLLYTSDAADE